MALKDLLKKKEKISSSTTEPLAPPPPPKDTFTIIRSDTNTQEVISAPSFPPESKPEPTSEHHESHQSFTKRFPRLRASSNASTASNHARTPSKDVSSRPSSRDSKGSKRLSGRFHLSHSRQSSVTSTNLPSNLPDIELVQDLKKDEDAQAAWEERATILAKENPNIFPHDGTTSPKGSRSPSPSHRPHSRGEADPNFHPAHLGDTIPRGHTISDAKSDDDIQSAIRMHESGDLENSTAMFGRLADKGNVMASILYGLALRHGWGIQPNAPLAITYLSRAASSSANVESEALLKGKKAGGAAKGELVLAIYELANSFRQGWGVEKDPVAARKYYEVAANLGDTDAMNEVAWCWEHGFGGKKDRYTAAQYYRLAEQNGSKTIGNTWIWKEKYNPKASATIAENGSGDGKEVKK